MTGLSRIAFVLLLWSAGPVFAQAPSRLLLNGDGQNNRYNGIGQMRGGSTCTAVLLQTSDAANAPAYALTNGHCINLLSANEVLIDQPPGGRRVVFHYFQDTPDKQMTVNVRRIAWASMKGTDLAVLELDATLPSLVAAGLQPWELASSDPFPGEEINVVGIPVTGLPSAQAFLRVAECVTGARVQLVEFNWHFFDMWLNACADIKGGSSGSPVLSLTRHQLIGLINTTTAGSPPYGDCYLNRPCEIGADGPRVRENTNYTIGLTGVRECFEAEGHFALNREGCPLDKGKQFRLTGYSPIALNPQLTGARVTWNTALSGSEFTYFRYKTGREEETDCRNPAGYSQAFSLAEQNRINDEILPREGRHYLCVLGGLSPQIDETWQPSRFATQVHVEIDLTPPRLPAVYQVRELTNERWQVAMIFVVPELSSYIYKFGKAGAVDCRDGAGYRDYLRVPINVSYADGPQSFCLIGRDNANNQTYPRELLLERGGWYELLPTRPPRRGSGANDGWPRRQ